MGKKKRTGYKTMFMNSVFTELMHSDPDPKRIPNTTINLFIVPND